MQACVRYRTQARRARSLSRTHESPQAEGQQAVGQRSRLGQGLRSRCYSDRGVGVVEDVAGLGCAVHLPEQVGAAHEGFEPPRALVALDVLEDAGG